MKKLIERVKRFLEEIGLRDAKPKPQPPVPVPVPIPVPPPKPPEPPQEWQRGYRAEMLPAVDGVVSWRTRNVEKPTGPNRDGGAEWIIARIEGDGFQRVLVMTMSGPRNPSRVYVQFADGQSTFFDGLFPVPLAGPSVWRVWATGDEVKIELDGRVLRSIPIRGARVRGAILGGYQLRSFIGEWGG